MDASVLLTLTLLCVSQQAMGSNSGQKVVATSRGADLGQKVRVLSETSDRRYENNTITEAAEPVCGNGIVEKSEGEECDDGNRNNDDTCSNYCHEQELSHLRNGFFRCRPVPKSTFSSQIIHFLSRGLFSANRERRMVFENERHEDDWGDEFTNNIYKFCSYIYNDTADPGYPNIESFPKAKGKISDVFIWPFSYTPLTLFYDFEQDMPTCDSVLKNRQMIIRLGDHTRLTRWFFMWFQHFAGIKNGTNVCEDSDVGLTLQTSYNNDIHIPNLGFESVTLYILIKFLELGDALCEIRTPILRSSAKFRSIQIMGQCFDPKKAGIGAETTVGEITTTEVEKVLCDERLCSSPWKIPNKQCMSDLIKYAAESNATLLKCIAAPTLFTFGFVVDIPDVLLGLGKWWEQTGKEEFGVKPETRYITICEDLSEINCTETVATHSNEYYGNTDLIVMKWWTFESLIYRPASFVINIPEPMFPRINTGFVAKSVWLYRGSRSNNWYSTTVGCNIHFRWWDEAFDGQFGRVEANGKFKFTVDWTKNYDGRNICDHKSAANG